MLAADDLETDALALVLSNSPRDTAVCQLMRTVTCLA